VNLKFLIIPLELASFISYVSANGDFSKITEKPIDMFPRTDTIKTCPRHQCHQLEPCGDGMSDVTQRQIKMP